MPKTHRSRHWYRGLQLPSELIIHPQVCTALSNHQQSASHSASPVKLKDLAYILSEVVELPAQEFDDISEIFAAPLSFGQARKDRSETPSRLNHR
jgi:hypothetical protein